ncbi:hypothetical protein BpHYR1_043467 [Brachionus plicatilis]|uniref:Uncharacterized protein n=1 Tax=Brachionus plicatilis TaxID=10195 RepID=A0A3M7P137_BRAPC|nr:hypothetical protein BpHYR1_043467 [Brachionus plicatilis]
MMYPDTDLLISMKKIGRKVAVVVCRGQNITCANIKCQINTHWPEKTKVTANGLERQPGEAVSDSSKILLKKSDEDTYEDYLDIPEEEINHVELRIPAGVDTTQPKRGRGRPKIIVNDFQATQSKKRAALNNNQNDADHVHESRNKRRKI